MGGEQPGSEVLWSESKSLNALFGRTLPLSSTCPFLMPLVSWAPEIHGQERPEGIREPTLFDSYVTSPDSKLLGV